jgi:hypothetical protein
MAGEIKQTTSIKVNQVVYAEDGAAWKNRTNERIAFDAK